MINPIAFQTSFFSIRWYGIMMLIGLFLGFLVWKYLCKEYLNKKEVIELYIIIMVGLFIGARLFHVIFYNWSYFSTDPIKILFIWNGGVSSHGAIVGSFTSYYIGSKIKKIDTWKILDQAIIGIALAVGFVRIGNFLNSELVGKITDLPWCVKFNNKDCRHPVQLYDAIKNFTIFIILYSINQSKKINLPKGTIFWLFIFTYSSSRFVTEYFKEYIIFNSGLTIGQYLSIPFIIISFSALILILIKSLPTRQ
ncbi:prolipoprotein diacylglyceryl transferase [archaeon]|jgi:phosphatidylglycerol---prolipoprotein diacylglyceryl transferase|nr:prolipoprotein diacylglyceryl transferase [archaeon]MBT3450989.1 prolipoprotein diacylglyceryl transferase [archaeon]MBT6868591.1 prolipoprotein diacylglyceryl transferase [archaeon]MBT7193123.1 prolipoprotein diacylglyceryl transferase [archaeon]MBT7381103.1 prolipoprotein diacylglyceryl transferase [archaeon]